MKTHQLIVGALVAALPAAGCSRDNADERARLAAAEMREAASRAGDQLADSWLTTKVQAQYFADEDIKARYLNVSTRDGVVTIQGRVDDENARRQALQIARNTDGVREVRDQLIVGGAGTEPEAVPTAGAALPEEDVTIPSVGARPIDHDELIRSRVQAKYYLDETLKRRHIQVDARERVVTLRGGVASQDERAQALLLARTTAGVDRVEDSLTIDATLAPASGVASPGPAPGFPGDAALTSQVRSSLMADAQTRAAAIEVTAKDGVVLLQGTVPTAAARARALAIAEQTPGVLQVVDALAVRP